MSSCSFDAVNPKKTVNIYFPELMPTKIRVLIVDDSALMRALLSQMVNLAPDMEVVGTAPDAEIAREMIKSLNPDVLTLDVQMPKMDGLMFLERLMRLRPMPVVMVSSFTQTGSETTLKALELGAVDFIGKPKADGMKSMDSYAEELVEKIRAAKGARLQQSTVARQRVAPPKPVVAVSGASLSGRLLMGASSKIIFVGASTGGTEAIKDFLIDMPADCPPIMVVQHMPESFTASFARRLDGLCAVRVIEAQGGEKLEPGTVYIAPGHSHLLVRRTGTALLTELAATPPINRHRPSVDVLFDSAATMVGGKAIGVILTGMGKDGAQGLLRMRQAGARTFGQDESSCVVYGMPREAFLVGAVEEQCPLDTMARHVIGAVNT